MVNFISPSKRIKQAHGNFSYSSSSLQIIANYKGTAVTMITK